ncbi:VanZ family protein [Diaminobutyricibacter sp. McL0608]|uniref:VanZ family protein n=1 Tax=Leifsonia sp. McL0608 TaxID=3143537 RepID=UPI0031F2EC4D
MNPHRIRLNFLFVGYLVLLVWIVLWKLGVPYIGGGALREIKLIPFVAADGFGTSNPLEVLVNVVLFVPFGAYLGVLRPSWRWWKTAGVIAVSSLLLEVTQYVLAIGSSDISDVISNTAGGLAGLGLLALARRRLQARTGALLLRWLTLGTVVAMLATAILVASPLRYAPPPDAGRLHAPEHLGRDRGSP